MGDSITAGMGVKDANKDSYPAQLGRILGSGWEVRNFGVSAMTMMKKGDLPYENRPEYQAALAYPADIIVIALGSNDSKPQNIEKNPDDFVPSYKEMIGKFRAARPEAKIFICLPPPAFPDHWGIRESVLTGTIIPLIQQVAKEEHVPVIDFHTAMAGKDADFPDRIHPNEDGARLLAETVKKAIAPGVAPANGQN